LARAFLGGVWEPSAMAHRGRWAIGRGDRWLLPFARRVLVQGPDPRLGLSALTAWIEADPGARRAFANRTFDPRGWYFPDEPIRPRLQVDGLPDLPDERAVAAWLGWTTDVLAGHADVRHWHHHPNTAGRFRDYVYRWRGTRLIEAPKDRLKAGQRRILRELLDRVPTHPAAFGFVRGRSPVTHAAQHVGQAVVMRVDLRQFFANVGSDRVAGFFRALGYPSAVAWILAGLTTTWTPADVTRRAPWCQPHLPQGAPTSPALANAVAWTLDARLTGLAEAVGLRYSRYADDLTFSGERLGPGLLRIVDRVVREEGFRVNPKKTAIFRRSRSQRVTGLVVNDGTAVGRAERDRLRAVLHRARSSGWSAVQVEGVADPRAWAIGRIAWITQANARHGAALQALLPDPSYLADDG
jgi:RNA-directed DNA polymerase